MSEARSKVTLRPRSKLERVLDALCDAYEIPARPDLDVLSQVTILLLVGGGAEPRAASAALAPLCRDDGSIDAAGLARATRELVASVCPEDRVQATLEALRAAGEVATRCNEPLQARCSGDLGEARWLLATLPGIDDQRADLVLLCAGAQAVVAPTPTASHVAARLGYPGTSYPALARALDAELPSFDAVEVAWRAHHLLDRHGKGMCSIDSPQCARCPVRSACSYRGQGDDPAEKLQPR